MLSKNLLLIVPGNGKQRSRKILLPSLIRTLIPLGVMGLTLLFGVMITDNMYQRQCLRQQQPQVSYVSEMERQLADKEGEISELKGQLGDINNNIDTIAELQNKIVSMIDEDGVTVATLSPAQQDKAADTPTDMDKTISSDTVHSLDEAYEQTQIYLSSMESYYDNVLTAYEIKQQHMPGIMPLDGTISSPFGNRNDPFISGISEFHNGVDIVVPQGTTIKAPGDGVVLSAAYEGGWGNRIRIDHGYGIVTFYAHLSQIDVKVGQKIKRGDPIGSSGNTGRSTGSHLHYGATVNKQPADPLTFLTPTAMTVSESKT